MNAELLMKLTELVSTLKGEGKMDLVALGMKALECFRGGKSGDGMKALLEASLLDGRFKEFLGKESGGVEGLAKAAGGLLGKFL